MRIVIDHCDLDIEHTQHQEDHGTLSESLQEKDSHPMSGSLNRGICKVRK